MKKLFYTSVALALVAGGIILAQQRGTEPKAAAADAPKQNTSEVSGRTQPAQGRYTRFGPNRNATVEEVRVKVGDSVKKGDLLVLLKQERGDLDVALAALACAKQELESADATLQLAELELEHSMNLRKTNVVADAEVSIFTLKRNDARAKKELAKFRIAEKEGEVAKAKANLDYFSIRAESNGTVISLNVVPGQIGRIAPDVSWGEVLDTSEMDVACNVPQQLLQKVPLGKKVTVRTERASVTGIVTFVGLTVEKDAVPVHIHLANPEGLRCYEPVKVSLE